MRMIQRMLNEPPFGAESPRWWPAETSRTVSIAQLEDREVPAHDREGDVVDGDRADEALDVPACPCPWRTRSGGARRSGGRGGRCRGTPRSPAALLEGRRGRRVVEEDDAERAAGTASSPRSSAVTSRSSRHRPPHDRLAEVGQRRVGKATHEALRADDPDLCPVEVEHGPAPARGPRPASSNATTRRSGRRASRGCRGRR